jgi:lipid II:glycine glycyltransferase (peptidoglycan interpeptide bridge formation enzyme)
MNIDIHSKNTKELFPKDILFQTSYWSEVKFRLGWKPVAFDFKSSTGLKGDFLVLIRSLGCGLASAHVPQGPEVGPEPEGQGLFLEALSQAMIKHLDTTVTFIRYDLPWESPYAVDNMGEETWLGHPAPRFRELRMNIGTRTWNLRKASLDLTVADALIVDLTRSEDAIIAAMKPKTRYNIRLAQRKGIKVFNATVEMLPSFYKIYLQTAKRNGFQPCAYRHFSALFSPVLDVGLSDIFFLLASKDQEIIAGAIIAISGRRASYLFGGSANEQRNLMAPYAVHWEGIRRAREKGCLIYDMGSVSPGPDSRHPFYGMYRFKTGFGGKIVHRNGSWDYPLDMKGYEKIRTLELLSSVTPAVSCS